MVGGRFREAIGCLRDCLLGTRRDLDLRVSLPANRNLLPPGYYLLFVLRDGVPSEALFVRIG